MFSRASLYNMTTRLGEQDTHESTNATAVSDRFHIGHGPRLLTSRQKYACPLSATCPVPALFSTIAASPALRVLDWVISRSAPDHQRSWIHAAQFVQKCGGIILVLIFSIDTRYFMYSIFRLKYLNLYNKCGSGQATGLPV